MINFDEVAAGPDAGQLQLISDLGNRQLRLEREVAAAEAALAKVSAQLRQVQEVDLPDAMAAAGCRAYTLTSGESISIIDGITASLSGEKRAAACAWLRANGYGDLVTDDVAISFGRGHEQDAMTLARELIEKGLIPAVTTNVNTATLKALIKEKLSEGVEMPLDTLGAYQWKKARVK